MTASSTSATTGTPPPRTGAPARAGRRRWLALAVVLAVEVMDLLDATVVGVASPSTGSAAGVLNAAQQLGGSVGVAVLGTAFFARAGHGMGAALDAVLPATAVALLLTSAVAFLMPRRAAHADAAH